MPEGQAVNEVRVSSWAELAEVLYAKSWKEELSGQASEERDPLAGASDWCEGRPPISP